MQVDFFITKDSNGDRKVWDLATGNVIYIRACEIFNFEFKAKLVGNVVDGDTQMEYGFLKRFDNESK